MVTWVPFTDRALKWHDLVANTLLFVPFGWTCPFARTRSTAVRLATAGSLALVISVGVEAYQVYCHNRFASATDVLFNVLGALLGARISTAGRGRA